MDILLDGREVGRLEPSYHGKLTRTAPELRKVTSRTYTICTGGSCLHGGAIWEDLAFDQLNLFDKIRELRLAGFAVRSDSGQVFEPPEPEPLTIHLKLT